MQTTKNEYPSENGHHSPCSPVVFKKKLPHPTSPRLLCGQLYRQTGSAVHCRADVERLGEATLLKTMGEWCPFSIEYIFFDADTPHRQTPPLKHIKCTHPTCKHPTHLDTPRANHPTHVSTQPVQTPHVQTPIYGDTPHTNNLHM